MCMGEKMKQELASRALPLMLIWSVMILISLFSFLTDIPEPELIILLVTMSILLYLMAGIHLVPEYERAVIFRLGRYVGVKGPGVIMTLPIIDMVLKVYIGEDNADIKLETWTKDKKIALFNLKVFFKVADVEKAVLGSINYREDIVKTIRELAEEILSNVSSRELRTHLEKYLSQVRVKARNLLRRLGVEIIDIAGEMSISE